LKLKSVHCCFLPLQSFLTSYLTLTFKLASFIGTWGSFPFNSTVTFSRDLADENLHGNPLSRGVLSINYGPSIELTNWLSTTSLCELGFEIKRGLVVALAYVNPFLIKNVSQLSPIFDRWWTNKSLMSPWWNKIELIPYRL
jgi:hypothetical protein